MIYNSLFGFVILPKFKDKFVVLFFLSDRCFLAENLFALSTGDYKFIYFKGGDNLPYNLPCGESIKLLSI